MEPTYLLLAKLSKNGSYPTVIPIFFRNFERK